MHVAAIFPPAHKSDVAAMSHASLMHEQGSNTTLLEGKA